jgi:DNA-binding MarR family transcriptional regulator
MTTRKALIQDIENQFLKLSHILKAVHSTPYDYGCGELLYPAEIHTLDCIGSNPDITVTELAERMGVTKGAISQIKSKLFKKKLLLKRNFANDQKKIALALSKKRENRMPRTQKIS